MKKNFLKYMLISGLFVTAACSDDFLEPDSRENVDQEHSDDVFEPVMLVNGVYGMLTDWNYAFAWLGVTEIISDNADKGSAPTDAGTDKLILDNLEHTSATPSGSSMWQHFYKTIGRASVPIQYTEEYGLTNETYKNRLIGEAKFLRALHYFWLVR